MRSFRRTVSVFFLLFLLCFLAACGGEEKKPEPTPAAVTQVSPSATSGVPPTETACPASKQARAAIMPALPEGSKDALIYLYNEGSIQHPETAVLRKFDPASGAK